MAHPEVTIEQGTLRGSLGTDIEGNKFYKFQGIPYAKPPLGELRFKAPVPPQKWTGVFDATKEGEQCYAKDPLKDVEPEGSEDCLVLNVFTKRLPDSENHDLKPVMFWIHGGGFLWGHGGEAFFGPDFLITEDVVVVTINYRLGLFGFISFEDPFLDVGGNAGLKDQVMALKWVQKNIAKFGGNPNNVTIFGQSAGAASIHLHVLSPMSKGLFHRAIAQSGCALNPWVIGSTSAKVLAKAMGLENATEKRIYDALIAKSKDEILEIQFKLPVQFVSNVVRSVTVVVEKNSKETFLPDEPIKIIKSGKFNHVPFMIGYTTREAMMLESLASNEEEIFDLENFVPYNLGYTKGSIQNKWIFEKIKTFYFGSEEPPEKNLTKIYDFLTDSIILNGVYVTVMEHLAVSRTPIYLYRMSLETELNFFKKLLSKQVPGVSHSDDICYLFKHDQTPDIDPGSIEDISVKRFLKLWANFAKFGNPTPDPNDSLLKTIWKPVSDTNLDFLELGEELIGKNGLPEIERMNFWKKLFSESSNAPKSKNE